MPDLATLHVRIDSNQAETRLRRLRNQAKRAQDEAHGRRRRGGITASARAMKSFANIQGQASTSTAQLNKRTGRLRETFNRLGKTLRGAVIPAFGRQAKATRKVKSESKETRSVLGKLMGAFDKLTGGMLRQIELWGLLGGVIIGAQAAYAGVAALATRAGATLAENSRKLSINTTNLQELQFAATATGTSVRDMRGALEDMNTSVTDAIKGQKSAQEAFQGLGIEFSTLKERGSNTNEMFNLVMQRLQDVDNTAKRLTIAEDIFGSSAASTLVNLIGNLDKARKAAREFDIVLSEDLVQSAAKTWNRIRLIWTVLKGQFIQAAANASDTIRSFANEILRAAKQGNLFERTIVPAVETTVGVIRGLIPVVRELYTAINFLYQNLWIVTSALKALAGFAAVKLFEGMTGAIGAAARATGLFSAALRGLGRVLLSIGKLGVYFALAQGILTAYKELQRLHKLVKETNVTFKDAAKLAIQKFGNFIINGFTMVGHAILGVVNSIVDPLVAMFAEAGKQAWRAFRQSFQFQNMAQGILGGFTGTPSGRVEKYGGKAKEPDFSQVRQKSRQALSRAVSQSMTNLKADWNRQLFDFAGDTAKKQRQFEQRQRQQRQRPQLNLPEMGRLGGPPQAGAGFQTDKQFYKEKEQALKEFNKAYRKATMTQTEFELSQLDKRYERYKQYVDNKDKLNKWYKQRQLETLGTIRHEELASTPWKQLTRSAKDSWKILKEGSKNAWASIKNDSIDTVSNIETVFTSAFNKMSQTLTDFIMTGKFKWKDFASSVIQMITKMWIKWQMFQAVKAASSWAGISFGAAKGAAFNNGQVMKYAQGGIVDKPTVFPMKNGAGVMGEAGPEAVMPLTRTSSGDLGVKTEGGSAPPVDITVVNNLNEEAEAKQEEPKFDGQKWVMNIVLDAANRNKNGFGKNLKGALSKV